MIDFLSTLILGVIAGYCLCLFRVNELQQQLNNIKIDMMHDKNKRATLKQLSNKA
tara:strand:- start:375 stop:539 length:165 start_codon:yes stop_codon:yes gene_type:complete